ncbi:putative perakine reductase [Helianthus annuus]|uniref:Perakine reductase n=1 Tax=Helianthus annuus TaxID=4232 RepID=A0A251UXD4_HELAN|nr:perakine reductase isoform X1 [Helianthus annuus]KAF5808905.1 putative perakine reductase [Helianthus annuus]KAJ0587327.1 putative perakine reductase [Helianthus annuus]KAJ0595895.1 putative perakine reductase [Helianthus annuus]KAJ0756552.1 putative perakine reductase [Helianthus annuus]KAJ0925517.1 putative perakine reductase [Helianthus annuus]
MATNKSTIEMPRVKLGNQGLEVSRLGYGCMGLTGTYNNPLSVEEGIKVLKEAFNKGITFFDTADVYGADHANELLIGKLLKELPRDKIQLATKFGIFKIEPTKVTVKGTPEYARSCCEGSLKRLGVDYIDLYYIHRIDTTVPIEDTMEELKKMVEEGKIKYIGLSEANADTIRRAHAVHPITALQMEYSLWTREIEDELIPLCRELGIGIVPYSPVGRGFFGGKAIKEQLPANSFLQLNPRFTGENLTKNKNIYDRVEAIAEKHGCSTAQLALAWVLHQGNDVVPIPGTTKIKNLEENVNSVNVKLTKEEIEEISNAVPLDEVAGSKINEALLLVSWKFANTPPKNSNRSS